jgi:hypothetical protein
MGAERRGNPFGWILLGFAVGVLATFGVILFLTAGLGGYDEGPEMRTAADDAAAAAIGTASAAPAPRKIEAPVVAAPPASTDVPDRETPAVDAQMADDAAASGMTSRASPDRPTR